MSLIMRKPSFCICENKDADQLRGSREADQHLCFRYIDTVIFLPMKPTPVTGIVPKAKKYLFFPIGARKIPKMSDNFPIKM